MSIPSQRVLIVDDETRNQRIIGEILEGIAEFKTTSTGEGALLLAQRYDPDVVLLDVMMPGIDGYDACRKIRALTEKRFTKVILISGKATLEERLKGFEAGADDYVVKPFAPEELLARLKVFLRWTRVERELHEKLRTTTA